MDDATKKMMEDCFADLGIEKVEEQPKKDAFDEMDKRKEKEASRPKKRWGQGYNDGKRR